MEESRTRLATLTAVVPKLRLETWLETAKRDVRIART